VGWFTEPEGCGKDIGNFVYTGSDLQWHSSRASVRMIEKHYGHLLREHAAKALAKLAI